MTEAIFGKGVLMSEDERGKPLDFLQAWGDRLYLFMDERGELSKYVLVKDRSQITESATIISKGKDVSDEFQVGGKVLVSYHSGIHLQIEESYTTSKFHRIVREHEILTAYDQEKRDAFNKE